MGRVKFAIRLKEVEIEFDGDVTAAQKFEAGIQESITSLTNAPQVALGLMPPNATVIDADSGEKPRRRRRRRSSAGENGSEEARKRAESATELIKELANEGFFAERRQIKDILKRLSEKAHTFEAQDISTPLRRLTQQGVLKREQNSHKAWEYWTE